MYLIILEKTLQHLYLSFFALLFAVCVALPLGFWLAKGKNERLTRFVIRAFSLVQTMPGLAMLALIVVVFSTLAFIPSTGFLPGMIALTLYALPPILTNIYTGIKQTSPNMIDVARGLGMRERQVLLYVEIPSAIPMILAGIRIAGVWTIGMGTLVSLIGCGGLGDLILQGLRSMNAKYVLAGTLPAAFLALLFEWGMGRLEKWLDSMSVY